MKLVLFVIIVRRVNQGKFHATELCDFDRYKDLTRQVVQFLYNLSLKYPWGIALSGAKRL